MAASKPLTGQTLVLTGKFADLSRKDAGVQLKALGAKVSGSVSGKTTALIAGRKAGSKLYDAFERRVPVLGEPHLKRLLGGEAWEDVVALAETFYTFDYTRGAPETPTFNVCGGDCPVALAKDDPFKALSHLFTVDLNTAPAFKLYFDDDARLLSFFASIPKAGYLDMCDIGNARSSRVGRRVFTQAEVDANPAGAKAKAPYARFELVARQGREALDDYLGRDRILGTVPVWCQYPEHQGDFWMQLSEGFGISGDGLIYVFDDAFFAQIT